MSDSGYPSATFGAEGRAKTYTTRDDLGMDEPALGYVPTEPDTWVYGAYNFTGFGDDETFEDLLRRHGLQAAGEANISACHRYAWGRAETPDPLFIATGTNPLGGECEGNGYVGDVLVGGEYAFAKPLWDDIAEMCTYNQGMTRPLCDGAVDTRDIPEEHFPKVHADHPTYPRFEITDGSEGDL